ncbi:Ig-like domain-containing protein [Cytophaga aurantiaca]|uniref:Ig-like domain-containing protein n=1 Tax=Cytophaga aurantiaca TaxID=29530 RepID=UPI0003761172|nr:Ig-like domain-containing protein [Cytophaga aurantiaca]
MKRYVKIIFLSIIFLSSNILLAQDQCKVVGWATQNGGVTGGGTATPTVVTTYAALKTALTTTSVKVVHVSGTITFPTNGRITIQDTDGKTIIGLAGSRMISVDKTSSGSGILYVKRTTNLIMRNLTFEGPGAYDVDGNDNLTFDDVQNAWVDHCDFQDGMDGNFDMKNMTNYISVTWCKFSYNKPPIAGGSGGSNDHRFTDLIGSSDGATQDAGKLKITFQYCWWAQGCVERMPRVRFGQLHIANCLYNSTVSNSCIRAGYKADLLIESNVFIGVNKPIDLYNNDFTAVTAKNNIFTNTSGGTTGSGTAFTPPYTLTISAASGVQSLVTNTACGSGATLDSPTQCGCGTVVNQNPTATLTAPASGATGCVGTAITISATATDDVSISKVDFYNGTTLLGSDNSSPYSITYTPTAVATLSIKATATDGAGLTGTSGTNTVTVNALPTATVSSSTTNLCTTGSIVLTASSGSSYKWFNGTTQVGTAATYTATAAGSYTVEVTNAAGCKAISAARTLTGTPQAIPTASSSTTNLCTTGSIVLTASSGSSYKWFNGTTQVGTASTYTATTAGDYTVEVTNASGCKATSAARILTGTPQATPTITSPATSFCTGGSVVLTSSSGTSYKWFSGTTQVGTASTYTATAAGSYMVEVTNASGCKATSTATPITISTAATPTISAPSTSICDGSSIVLTSSTGASYKWFNGTAQVGTAATYTATTSGPYTVEVTYTGGCKATSAVTQIGITALPIATITAPATSFCTGGSVILTASTGSSYKWFSGTTQVGTASTYTATAAGAYTVEVTNASGCKATSAVTQIGVNTLPTATITAPATSFCTGGSVILASSTGSSYKWFNGTTQVGTAATYTATTAGAYTVEVTNASGCKATSAVTQISVNTLPTATITTPTTSICSAGSVVLTASTGSSYKWFNGTTQVGTNASYTATAAGNYTVEVTNASGCKATSAVTSITLSTSATPTITAPVSSICDGSSVVLTASSGVSYKWFNGTTQVGTSATYTATTSGAYTVEVTNAGGCKGTSAVTQIGISALPIATISASATSFCTGKSAVLTASTGTSYKWFNGTTQVGTAATYTATTVGDYTVEVANSNGCKATSTITQITVTTIPTPIITAATTSICSGGTAILASSSAASYKWFNGTTQVGTSSAYTARDAGAYTVEITDANGCKATSAVTQINLASYVTWYADTDNDGVGDAAVSVNTCTQPNGYVATSGDNCPTDVNKTEPGNCGCNHIETPTCITTGTINGSNPNIKVVPQPFDLNTSITIENLGTIQSVTIISSSGAIVEIKQGLNTESILIGDSLASGLYTVLIQSETGIYTTKIVKK